MSDTLAQRLEEIVEKAKERLLGLDDAIREAVGDAPFAGRRMSSDQQMEGWLLGRSDPAYWQAMIQQSLEHHGLPMGSGVPKDVLAYDLDLAKRWEERNSPKDNA